MLRSRLGDDPEVNQVLADEFKIQDDVKMYSQLPGYDDFQRLDIANGCDFAATQEIIYGCFYKPSWQTLKHHLLNGNITEKLFMNKIFTLISLVIKF